MREAAVRAVRVSVPASTANLGSGFDTLGMALAIYDTLEVRVLGSGLDVRVDGAGANDVPRDERHLVLRALLAAAEYLELALPGIGLRAENVIPHARGLGSSSAAVVAGIAAAYGLASRPLDARALQLAAEFDGHADNAAASLYGGLVVAWSEQAGEHPAYRAVRLEPHGNISLVALVPPNESSTQRTRALLPEVVPHADAAFAASRAALAVHALTAAPELLMPATEDRLHQDYREPALPRSVALVRELRAHGIPAVISGAGPSVLAFGSGGSLPGGLDLSGFEARPVEVDLCGVQVQVVD
ncbi:MAG: homoserine kinase [Sciscionella sp.]